MGNHELLLGTLRKKEFSKEIQGVVAAVLDSRVRVPNPVGIETVLRMVGRCGKILKLRDMGMRKNHTPHPEISRKDYYLIQRGYGYLMVRAIITSVWTLSEEFTLNKK